MSKDLFASFSVSKITTITFELETRINHLVSNRHDYPMGPEHDRQPDEFEEGLHAPIRHVYYKSVILLIHTLQELRNFT